MERLFGVTVMSLGGCLFPWACSGKPADRQITGRDSVPLAQQNHWKPINGLKIREGTVAKEQAPRGQQLPVWAGTAM